MRIRIKQALQNPEGAASTGGAPAPATMEQRKAMPMQVRAMPISGVDKEKRTCEMVFSTGAAVRRRDWWTGERYMEVLSLEPGHVRMDRFKNGAVNIIDTHDQWSIKSILGIAEDASVDGKEGRCTGRFSSRADVEPFFQDVADAIIRNISVGYIVHRYEKIDPPANSSELPTWRAIDWEPCEVSLCAVNADAGAGMRSNNPYEKENGERIEPRTFPCEFTTAAPAASTTNQEETNMRIRINQRLQAPEGEAGASGGATTTTRTEPPAPPAGGTPPAPAGITEAQRTQILTEERTRADGITTRVKAAGLGDDFARTLVDDPARPTLDQAAVRIADELVARQSRGGDRPRGQHDIRIVNDEVTVIRTSIAEAIQHRAAPQHFKLTDAGRQYRGMDLMDIARDCVERAGGRTRGMSRREIAVCALNLDPDMQGRSGMHSTSDFVHIASNIVNRTLRSGYDLSPRTFVPWCRPATLPDFKQAARVALSEISTFAKVNEGGEYKALSISDSAEKYSLGKYGGIIAITWEMLINDDLDAFDRLPRSIGDEAAATEADIVYGMLLGTSTMSDNVALFHADHGNLAGAGAAISETSLAAGRAAMKKQKGKKGRVLNLSPDYLLVGADKELEANKFTSAQFVAAKAADVNPNFNTQLEVISEARITGNQWYLSASPGRVDTIEYAHLEGEDGVFTEYKHGFEVDGLQIKGRLVFAAKPIDWVGMYKNPGA